MNKTKIKRPLILAMAFLFMAAPSLTAKRILQSGSLREPVSLDPAQAWNGTPSFYINNIFDTLVRLNPQTMEIEPALAVSWVSSRDGLNWTFKLRQGVYFHDGTTFDADAVIFTFSRQMNPAQKNRKAEFLLFSEIFTFLQSVKKIDNTRVQLQLAEPFSPFLSLLTTDCAAIVSPAAVKKTGAKFAEHPVGTGPFKLTQWLRGKRLILEANGNYWRGRPEIDEFIDHIEPRAEILNTLFKEGKIDILFTFSISKMFSYSKLSWVNIITMPTFTMAFAVPNTRRDPLKRKAVRQALSLAWDPRLLKLVFQDYVLPIHTVLPKGILGYDQEDQGSGFSLAKARTLLGKDGMAKDLQLEMILRNEDNMIFLMFSLYAKNLKQIGIKLKISRLPGGEYRRRIAAGNYDLAFSGWNADYPDPDSMLFPWFSKQLQRQGFANLSGCERKDLVALLIQARRESNPEKRAALYVQINRAICGDSLAIPLYQDKKVIIYNQNIGQIQENPLGRLSLSDLKVK